MTGCGRHVVGAEHATDWLTRLVGHTSVNKTRALLRKVTGQPMVQAFAVRASLRQHGLVNDLQTGEQAGSHALDGWAVFT